VGVKSGTVSFSKRVPNFSVRSEANAGFSKAISIIPILTPEPVKVVSGLLLGLFLLYETVESFQPIAGVESLGVLGVGVGFIDVPTPPPPPPQLITKAANPISIELFLKLYFFKIFCAIIILIRMARFLTYDS